ncbi:hypothetical protein [Lunatimonas salinarum]|uniref:hypothetical protein n=1 Tax=Lunatimonas salinarum TaxID=1774590 RepID=UPI001ADF2DDF|nr:hypothetical protein [Lunatimonas salinarum]
MKNSRVFLPLLLMLLAACSSSVRVTGSWTSPSKPAEGYKRVFVTALTKNVLARQTVEMHLEDLMRAQGVTAFGSFEIMPVGFRAKEADRDEVLSKIKKLGSEAILTIALLDQTSETRYVPGNTMMYTPMGFGYHGRFWSYYNTYNPLMYDAGYYTTDKNYYLEANLYDTDSEQLIWSSQSTTVNPSSLDGFANAFAAVVVKQLIKDGVIITP